MKVTYYGHATFLVELGQHKVLFDPFISGNEAASHINIEDINPDYILVTHGHQDHVLDVVDIAKRSGAQVISNFEIIQWFGQQGLENLHPLNHGGGVNLPFGRVVYVNAVHTSSLPDGSYGGQPGGFVVIHDEGVFYYSGDTALTYDMKLIGEHYDVDLAFLCLGDNFTMDYKDASRAANFVGTHNVIGMHFDTFDPIKIDHDVVRKHFTDAHQDLYLMGIGEERNF